MQTSERIYIEAMRWREVCRINIKEDEKMELEKIRQIIAGILNVNPDEVNADSAFIEDLGADSLDVFQIIMGVEEEFDIEISPEEAERISTVAEAVELVRNAAH